MTANISAREGQVFMPIYEYRCGECKRKVSIFFPSFSAAETRIAAGENKCPQCGSGNLTRLMSRARAIRAVASGGGGDDPTENFDPMLDGLDEDDPRAVARWARQMKESMGEELDMGPEFDRALARIEAGEDPDKVMEDLDPEALEGGADEDFDEGDDDDFTTSSTTFD
jgi:putative FmdB family regulatory protein